MSEDSLKTNGKREREDDDNEAEAQPPPKSVKNDEEADAKPPPGGTAKEEDAKDDPPPTGPETATETTESAVKTDDEKKEAAGDPTPASAPVPGPSPSPAVPTLAQHAYSPHHPPQPYPPYAYGAASPGPPPYPPGYSYPPGAPPYNPPPPGYGSPPPPVAAAATAEATVEEKGEIAPSYVGKVIGRGGEMIRDLQARSGARIDVDQNVPEGQPRGITYRGSRKTVDAAKHLVSMLQQEGVRENDLPLGDAKRKLIVIPATAVGKIIGRGGEMIRELQNKSQAKIQVDHAGASGIPADQKQVSVIGTVEAVAKGEEIINFLVANPLMEGLQSIGMLVEEKSRSGQPWGTGPPYPGLPNQGANMDPNTVGGGAPPQSAAAPPYGQYASPYGQPYPPSGGGPPGVPGPYGAGGGGVGPEVDTMFAQKQFMGRIIGKKGATINDLQRRSSCDIQVNQEFPQGQDCEITLRGSRQGIEMAKEMIREIIRVGPQHPYAGGAESYNQDRSHAQQQPYHQPPHYSYPYHQPHYAPPPSYHYPPHYGYPSQPAPYPGYPPAASGPPPAPVASPPPASAEWKSTTSPDGQVYYYNERTGATQWDKPMGMN